MNTTGVSPEEEFSSDINENLEDQPQPDPDTVHSSTPKKRSRLRPNNAIKDKKDSDKYNQLCWASTEPPQPMRRHI